MAESDDAVFMRRALEVADLGVGRVSPNPPVGAVAVRDGRIVAEGYHRKFGGRHAEADLIHRADPDALRGADLYVTLEPCGHQGKTPPCAEAVIAVGFRRVVWAVPDPNPRTAGVGPARLREAGIEVAEGIEAEAARYFHAPYLKWVRRRIPLVTAKWAMTADGRIATSTGDSQWISSEASLARTRAERSRFDAIMVGRGTQRGDDPLLTNREDSTAPQPLRVVLDSGGSLPLDSRLVGSTSESPVIVFVAVGEPRDPDHRAELLERGVQLEAVPGSPGRLDLDVVLARLGERGVAHLLVEGGSTLHGSLLDAALVDRVQIIVAPKIVGGHAAPGPVGGTGVLTMAGARDLTDPTWTITDGDARLDGVLTPEGRGDVS